MEASEGSKRESRWLEAWLLWFGEVVGASFREQGVHKAGPLAGAAQPGGRVQVALAGVALPRSQHEVKADTSVG